MRCLRTSLWVNPVLGIAPVTTIARDSDFTDTLESVRERLLNLRTGEGMDGFITFDIYSMDDADIEPATLEGMRRWEERKDTEANMAILYFWVVDILPGLADDGHCIIERASPLDTEDIKFVLAQIARNEFYKDTMTVSVPNEDDERTLLTNGKIEEAP